MPEAVFAAIASMSAAGSNEQEPPAWNSLGRGFSISRHATKAGTIFHSCPIKKILSGTCAPKMFPQDLFSAT
ncbi:MAG: hypothetical protein IJ523_10995 [Succinivibrionaceae bacterium]|nr:hypothetical protein [Succinivibrionaceae bacterium]